jgi:hypothetical protein
VPRADAWGDTALEIPSELAGSYVDRIGGDEVVLEAGPWKVGERLARWPVALLERD